MAFADFNKTTPLCFYLVSLPKNSKSWQESFVANSWMGGGVGGFLFPLEDNSELPPVESADSFLNALNAFDGMSDDLDLHHNNSIGNKQIRLEIQSRDKEKQLIILRSADCIPEGNRRFSIIILFRILPFYCASVLYI